VDPAALARSKLEGLNLKSGRGDKRDRMAVAVCTMCLYTDALVGRKLARSLSRDGSYGQCE
jgi:hypothetical protein